MKAGEQRYLTALRRELHRRAETAGAEQQTAARLLDELQDLKPDTLVRQLAGHGLAAVFGGDRPGPTVLLRADLDALPIDETIPLDHASLTAGVSHKCGHDGHMTIAVGIARKFSARPPTRGRVVVLFQPSEETGDGAAAVIDDPAFTPLRPDAALALHNLPGFEPGCVVVRAGVFACASRGLVLELGGESSHAAEPHQGRSPALAVAQVIEAWSAARQLHTGLEESGQATVIHAAVGSPAFGTSPGSGRVMVTLRAASDEMVQRLEKKMRDTGALIAAAYGLEAAFSAADPFSVTVNDPGLVKLCRASARAVSLEVTEPAHPFAWSEDFGHFGRICPAALIGLGAGRETPALHHSAYDFPDELIPHGVSLLENLIRKRLDRDG